MLTLRRISQQQEKLLDEIFENQGELTPQQEQELYINSENLSVKTEGYLDLMQSLDSESSMLDMEIKRLQDMKKRNAKLYAFLESNLVNAVKTFGPIQTDFRKISIRHSQRLIVNDVHAVPGKYVTIKQEIKVNADALKQAIKDGEIKPTEDFYIQEMDNLKTK